MNDQALSVGAALMFPVETAAEETKRMRCIPQAYDFMGEIANVRTLLRLGRAQEALLRLELTLDRKHSGWRTRGANG